jgi:hypothetical protein
VVYSILRVLLIANKLVHVMELRGLRKLNLNYSYPKT